ncbi:MAG: hypothetical protein LBC07_03325 [Elusimicrobiota bacterium]|nr:hypothetical protein [Elusimicrobiota bacterium]
MRGETIFETAVILETITLEHGAVNFRAHYSSANIVNAQDNGAVSLAGNGTPSRLFANEIL